ncbi:hypothetical protein AB395_00001202 [Sinorhizobium fredii CCBAU 45436]|nr:hypothetical protein AB395_00001202 [Sinorhizobium fredii CCBAU 45436]
MFALWARLWQNSGDSRGKRWRQRSALAMALPTQTTGMI